tara:strand:- start:2617 stop:3717 length:1101 start_codon:yes stop_codon:yes gene_type:complete
MKKNRNIKAIPVVAISNFGHCGLDWLHSLIDSHKEILILPGLSFFRKIEILKKRKINFNNNSNLKEIVNIFAKELFNNKAPKKYNIITKKQSKSKFKKYIFNFLVTEKNLEMEKRLFFAIHYAFVKINKINLSKIKRIVAHEHVPWNCYQYDECFNSKFIFIVRDPRASIAGSLRMFQRSKNIPINFQIDMNLSYVISAQIFCKKLSKKVLILKNENMHNNLKPEMKKLAKWLNIKFNNSLLNSTFLGKKWIGESGYLRKSDLEKPYPKDYYKPSNVESRWRNILDKNTILIIETVSEKIMKKYNYSLDNNLNVRSKFFGYLNLLFRFNQFNNFLSVIKLNVIKNVIRRFFIVFFSNQSRKIFDIA